MPTTALIIPFWPEFLRLRLQNDILGTEASGAIAICPPLARPEQFAGQIVGCILTGANIHTALLAEILTNH